MKKTYLAFTLCSTFVPLSVHSECISAPNCEELGFTADVSKCEGNFVKCPWDLTKASCRENKDDVGVGSILYGDGTISNKLISDKTPIGIIFDTSNRLAIALADAKSIATGKTTMPWVNRDCDISGLSNCDAKDFTCGPDGRANTDAILKDANNGTCQGSQTITACDSYFPTGCSKDFCQKTKWFLPSTKEWSVIFSALPAINTSFTLLGDKAKPLTNGTYWASTEKDYHQGGVAIISTLGVSVSGKMDNNYYVRPVVKY